MTALLMLCTAFLAEHLLAAHQGLAVGWVPCPRTLGQRRQLQVATTFSSSPKTTGTLRQVHFPLGTGPALRVPWPQARLHLRMEATPSLSTIQTKACPQIHFDCIQWRKYHSWLPQCCHKRRLSPWDAGALSIRNKCYSNFVGRAWALGPSCVF